MPTYTSYCVKCDKEIEYISKISEKDNPPNCETCGNKTEKTYTKPEGGFILKGGGWYKSGGFKSILFTFLLLNSTFKCANPSLINASKEPWNKRDIQEFQFAFKQERCKDLYPANPCMESFVKVEPLTYRVVCGPTKASKSNGN